MHGQPNIKILYVMYVVLNKTNVKSKVQPRTGHEGTERQ